MRTPEYHLAPLGKRVVAKAIDVAVAGLGAGLLITFGGLEDSLFGFLFALAGAATYLLLADSMNGRSIGKRILGLKVLDYQHGSACSPFQSLVRNAAGLGLLRVLQIAEEEDQIAAGKFRGTVVIDLSDQNPDPDSSEVAAGPREPRKFDMSEAMDIVRGETEDDSN